MYRELTNTELLDRHPPERLLTEIEKQKLYLLKIYAVPKPCPACGHGNSLMEARGEHLDEYDFGKTKKEMHCTKCKTELTDILPFFGGEWHWGRK